MPPTRRATLTASRTDAKVGENITITAVATENGAPVPAHWTFAADKPELADVSPVTTKSNKTVVQGLAAGEVTISGQTTNLTGDEVSSHVTLRFGAPVVTPPPPPVVEPTPTPVPPTPAPTVADRIFAAPREPVAATATRGASYVAYDTMFPLALATVRALEPTQTADVVNYYDRALVEYAMAERHGVPAWAAVADATAVRYRDEYLAKAQPAFAVQAHQAQLRGLALHALRTGDAASRDAVVRVAENLWVLMVNTFRNDWDWDWRMMARTIETQLCAAAMGGTPSAYWPDAAVNFSRPHTYADRCHEVVRRGLARHVTTGDEAGLWSGMGPLDGLQLNYQIGMWHEALAVYVEQGAPDAERRAAVVAAIRRGHDYLWTRHWLGASGGFNYATKAFDYLLGGQRMTGGPGAAGDLTGMFVAAFAWDARESGDAERRSRAETVFAAAVATAYLAGSKQFTEFFGTSWRAFGWLPPVA